MTYLGLTPGSVSAFGLINDAQKVVEVVIDASLFEAEEISFHPNVNTATLVMDIKDFKRFLEWSGHTTYKVKI